MDDQAGLKRLRADLEKLKLDGAKDVSVESLTGVVDSLLQQAGSSFQERSLQSTHSLAEYDAKVRLNVESFKATIEAGREALNTLVLINGGAVVALLGLAGALASKGVAPSLAHSLREPLIEFGSGVLCGAIAFGIRYLAQGYFTFDKDRVGFRLNVLSIVFALCGYAGFGYGLYRASSVL